MSSPYIVFIFHTEHKPTISTTITELQYNLPQLNQVGKILASIFLNSLSHRISTGQNDTIANT